MNKVLSALLLVVGLCAGVNAGAIVQVNVATYNLNTLPASVDGVETDFSYGVPKGLFNDTIDFSLAGPSTLEELLFSNNTANHSKNITGLTMSLYNSSNTLIGMVSDGGDVTLNGVLGAGNYYAVITGQATGKTGGLFTGSFIVSSVPESSTIAMLALGLGLIGFTMMRRKI